ncbi:hypothetical protein FOZ61_000948 [Perkinsus olseni]|uniref:Uncharacterized protein n=2 Tax=Perkinsus olseni TaxID=32597 RepID=A0A7J6LYB7_PEROL|nr:hypothetical protein FOZ61_000948 [Perkinsus olseni]
MVMHLFPADLADRVGGREAVLMVVKRFYELSFEDPILGCLYEDKEEPHYKMFCRWLFTALGLDDEMTKRGGTRMINTMHKKAQHCPHRATAPKEAGYVGAGFTQAQRNRWIRMQFRACEEFNLPREFVEPYIHGLCVFMAAYGPFTENRAEEGPQHGECPMKLFRNRTESEVKISHTAPHIPGFDLPSVKEETKCPMAH